MRYFGDMPQTLVTQLMQKYDTPLGEPCYLCDKPIAEGDKGFELLHQNIKGMPHTSCVHHDCFYQAL